MKYDIFNETFNRLIDTPLLIIAVTESQDGTVLISLQAGKATQHSYYFVTNQKILQSQLTTELLIITEISKIIPFKVDVDQPIDHLYNSLLVDFNMFLNNSDLSLFFLYYVTLRNMKGIVTQICNYTLEHTTCMDDLPVWLIELNGDPK